MEFLLLMALAVFGIGFIDTGSSEDVEDDTLPNDEGETPDEPITSESPDTPDAPETPDTPDTPDGPFSVSSNSTITGTDGADIISLIPEDDGVENARILAGDGDDTIDLYDEDYDNTSAVDDRYLIGSQVDAGDGDDVLNALVLSSGVDMGDGDDTVSLVPGSIDSVVDLGAGDDVFDGFGGNGPQVTVNGADGDDTITGNFNMHLNGGAGDDVISFSGLVDSGAGYATQVDGGDGNDTISFSGPSFDDPGDSPLSPLGGAGADLFDLDISEVDTTDRFFDASLFEQPDGSLQIDLLELPDFTPGEDMIRVDATPSNDGYDLTTASLEPGTDLNGNSITTLVLRYEHATEAAQETSVVIGSGGVDWDDITFVGDDIPTLEFITPSGS